MSAAHGVVVLGTGGSQSPSYLSLVAIPLAISLISRETPLVSLASGITAAISGAFILRAEGRPTIDILVVEESCDPAASIETAVRIASVRAKGIAAINVEAAPLEKPLAMNGARLVQVLVNLLVNAVDAIESKPQREQLGNVWVQLAPGKLIVADDGPGLSSEASARMFEPFFTTKPRGKGTGLGLALCRQYLSEHGYSITADGRPGGGARFIVNFS